MPKIDVNGVGIYYEASGLDDKVPFFLTGHGRKSWMWQTTCLSEYYKVVTHDRRGTGASDDPPGDWTIKDFSEDVIGLMDALSIEKAIVGGHSLGGAISCQLGLDHPERVLALVFSGQGLYFGPMQQQWIDDLASGKAEMGYQPKAFEWEERGPPTADPEIVKTRLGAYFASLRREEGSWRTSEQRKLNTLRMIKSLRNWDLRPRADELKRLGEKVPVLISRGEFESKWGTQAAWEWHKAIPNSRFVIVKGCYHGCPRDDPAQWNRNVLEFLRDNGL